MWPLVCTLFQWPREATGDSLSNFLVEIVFYFFAIVMWIFASPILFGILQQSTITGSVGLVLHIIPWVVVLFMVGRLIFVLRSGGSA